MEFPKDKEKNLELVYLPSISPYYFREKKKTLLDF